MSKAKSSHELVDARYTSTCEDAHEFARVHRARQVSRRALLPLIYTPFTATVAGRQEVINKGGLLDKVYALSKTGGEGVGSSEGRKGGGTKSGLKGDISSRHVLRPNMNTLHVRAMDQDKGGADRQLDITRDLAITKGLGIADLGLKAISLIIAAATRHRSAQIMI